VDAITESLSRAVQQLLGRSSGPLHFRLVIQPIVATILAIRAGMRDARAGRPAFFWTFLTDPTERKRLAASGWKDIGKIFIVALVLDTVYQLIALRGFYVVQALIVAIAVALVPYVLLRGPASRIARSVLKKQ
jgi:hypothetical protein